MCRYIVSEYSEFATPVWCGEKKSSNIYKKHNSRTFSPYPSIDRRFYCTKRDGGDGIFNTETRRWQRPPCKRRNCFRHWRRYAKTKIKQLQARLTQHKFNHHLVLHTKIKFERGKRYDQFSRWQRKVIALYPDSQFIAVKHCNRSGVHYHVLLSTDHILCNDSVRAFWKSHFPAKKYIDWRPQYLTSKPHDNPHRLIRYMFLGKWKQPRKIPPWYGLRGHSVYTISKLSIAK